MGGAQRPTVVGNLFVCACDYMYERMFTQIFARWQRMRYWKLQHEHIVSIARNCWASSFDLRFCLLVIIPLTDDSSDTTSSEDQHTHSKQFSTGQFDVYNEPEANSVKSREQESKNYTT